VTASLTGNGQRERNWETRADTVQLSIPKLRTGHNFPAFHEPRRLCAKALSAVVQEPYIQGISTWSVGGLVRVREYPAFRKARSVGCVRTSTSLLRRSWGALSRATGHTCGSTRRT
jgi:transposase-like protein